MELKSTDVEVSLEGLFLYWQFTLSLKDKRSNEKTLTALLTRSISIAPSMYIEEANVVPR